MNGVLNQINGNSRREGRVSLTDLRYPETLVDVTTRAPLCELIMHVACEPIEVDGPSPGLTLTPAASLGTAQIGDGRRGWLAGPVDPPDAVADRAQRLAVRGQRHTRHVAPAPGPG